MLTEVNHLVVWHEILRSAQNAPLTTHLMVNRHNRITFPLDD